ncbi:MAG: hypothetical protein GWO08_11485, partial [Gammaproteobacteria bacterium]|nr:hypothetical protein [Gammaproteobacteria bacterium]NIR94255.1 hypothetical protein [Gammaproteobacteria bacterium]NIW46869.1 hypothetical protein [Gammaproteobacteria bacterium]NIX57892.1 hypothetical protein [candidate division Zixibacteria bacterium]
GTMGVGGLEDVALIPPRDNDIENFYGGFHWRHLSGLSEWNAQAYFNQSSQDDRYRLGPISEALGYDPAEIIAIYGQDYT